MICAKRAYGQEGNLSSGSVSGAVAFTPLSHQWKHETLRMPQIVHHFPVVCKPLSPLANLAAHSCA